MFELEGNIKCSFKVLWFVATSRSLRALDLILNLFEISGVINNIEMLSITSVPKVPIPDICSSYVALKAARLPHSLNDFDEVVGGFMDPRSHGTSAVHEQQQV